MKNKKGKRALLISLALIVIFAFSSAAYASDYYGTKNYSTGLHIYCKTWFTPGYKTNSKYAKYAWSRLTEGQNKVYVKSPTLTSSQAKNKNYGKQIATADKENNPFKNQTYDNGWVYI